MTITGIGAVFARVGAAVLTLATLAALAVAGISAWTSTDASSAAGPSEIRLVNGCTPTDTTFLSNTREFGWYDTSSIPSGTRQLKFRTAGGSYECENGRTVKYATAYQYKVKVCNRPGACQETDWLSYPQNSCPAHPRGSAWWNTFTGCDPYLKMYHKLGAIPG